MLRVLACIDEPILAHGLTEVLNAELDTELRCVTSLLTLLAALEVETPNVVLINLTPDIHMQTIRTIASNARGCHVVLWVRAIDPDFACETVRAGIRGVLRKTLPNELLVRCLQKVAAGELWVEKSVAKQLIERKPLHLTARERDLIDRLAQGLRNKEIAWLLNLTEASVKVYVSRLLKKLGLKDRFELALYGLKHSGSMALEPNMERPPVSAFEEREGLRKTLVSMKASSGQQITLRRPQSA
ncbi:MAG TPA: response regulator transcription factor [Bryobacteraceae bacterium]|nr:response regulator transcription factor [Bryobacteraceae bacterium]